MTLDNYVPGPQTQWLRARAFVLARDHHRCRKCGGTATHVDHVWPRALGGASTPENLQALCRPCNSRKGARPPAGMLPMYLTVAPDTDGLGHAERAEARSRAWWALRERMSNRCLADGVWPTATWNRMDRATERSRHWARIACSHRHVAYAVEHGLTWVLARADLETSDACSA